MLGDWIQFVAFARARQGGKVIDPLMEDFHFQATFLTKGVLCRASGADSSSFSNGSTQDESILVQQQRTCCSESKKRHYCTVLSPIDHTYYCIDCTKATQPMPARRQR
jgi:hypothetical protein